MKFDSALCKLLNFTGVVVGLASVLPCAASIYLAELDFYSDDTRLGYNHRARKHRLYERQVFPEKPARLPVNAQDHEPLWTGWSAVRDRSYEPKESLLRPLPTKTRFKGPGGRSTNYVGNEQNPLEWPEFTFRSLTLEERFRVPAVDDVIEKHLGKYNPKATDGSWLNPLSVVKNTGSREEILHFEHESTKQKDVPQRMIRLMPGTKKDFPSLQHPYASIETQFILPQSFASTDGNNIDAKFEFTTQADHNYSTKIMNDWLLKFGPDERPHLSVMKDSNARHKLKHTGTEITPLFMEPNTILESPSRSSRDREKIDRNYFRRPKAGFIDNALLSIEDYQKELRDLKDIDLSNRFDAYHTRQVGPLCGVFLHPLFHAELRALNITSYILRNVYVSPRTRLNQLTVVFEVSGLFKPKDFTIHLPDRPFLRGKQYVLQGGHNTREVRRVTIRDNSGNFTVSLDVSRCIIPQFLKGSAFTSLRSGITTGVFTMYTSNFMIVSNFTYYPSCPAAYFWAGRGRNPSHGFKIPVAKLGLNPLRTYRNEDVYVGLPNAYTWYDVNYVAVFCPAHGQVMTYLLLPNNLWRQNILPPAITTLDVAKNLQLF